MVIFIVMINKFIYQRINSLASKKFSMDLFFKNAHKTNKNEPFSICYRAKGVKKKCPD